MCITLIREPIFALEEFCTGKERKLLTETSRCMRQVTFLTGFHSVSHLAPLIGPDLVGEPIVMTTGGSLFLW